MTTTNIPDYLLQLKNEQDIKDIISNQNQCLTTFKNAQQRLEAFNKFSEARYQQVYKQFELHSKLLKQTREDLNTVFVKLRNIKKQLSTRYPNEMEVVLKKYPPPEILDD